MINFSTFLLESRLDFLKHQHQEIDSSHDSLATHRSAPDIIDHFATHADPSANKANTRWIINRYKAKDFRQEDHPRIRTALEDFQKHKSKLAQKDINHYRSLSDLEDAVEPHLGTMSKKQEKSQIKHEGADLIHDGPEFMVHKLKTKEAACHYGKGTKWCTAADKNNKFDSYNEKGPLFVVTHKKTQEKHQFHFESNQFMDAKDNEIDLDKFVDKHPELKEVKEFRDKSPYFGRNDKEVHEIIDKILKDESGDESGYVRYTAIRHPNATTDHISTALNDKNGNVREAAIGHPNATTDHISTALKDESEYVRKAAIQHPNATPDHISTALKDEDEDVRWNAIEHPNATTDHISTALNDKNGNVRWNAIEHPNATSDHISTALKDESKYVRWNAIEHPNATTDHISTALKDEDEDEDVRWNAIEHPNATSDHISTALKDKSKYNREAAIKIAKKRGLIEK